jgi:hypothetical protein
MSELIADMNKRNGMSQTFIERTQSNTNSSEISDYQSNIDEVLTLDEVMEISGYQPEQAELIDREFMLQRDGEPAEQRDSSENPLVRLAIATLLVGGVLGLGWIIWSLFFASKPKATPVGSSTPKPTPTKAFESDEASRLKAELALRNQASRTQQQQKLPQPKSTPSPSPKPKSSPKPVAIAPPETRIIRESAPPRIIQEKVPVPAAAPVSPRPSVASVPSPRPSVAPTPQTSPPEKPVDPLERWNQLATLGQQTIKNGQDADLASPSLARADAGGKRKPSTVSNPTAITSTTASVTQPTTTSKTQPAMIPPTPTNSAQTQPTAIPVVSIGSAYTSPTNGASTANNTSTANSTFTTNGTSVANDTSPTNDTSTANSTYATNSPSIADSNLQSAGVQGILNSTPISEATTETGRVSVPGKPMQVRISTSTPAKVLVPMIWSEEDKGSQERFAVELEEDVLSTDNRVALPKGTILITEVDSVTKANKLVKQSVVAIVYPDSSGQIRQETVPKDSILIRGENNRPLIAQGIEDKGKVIAQQDILVGLLGAAGRAAEIFNQPETQSSTVFNDGSSSQTVTTASRKPNLLAAAVEGFFKPMSERLGQRADQTTQEILSRPDVGIVPQGTRVSVFFNTFFEVTR